MEGWNDGAMVACGDRGPSRATSGRSSVDSAGAYDADMQWSPWTVAGLVAGAGRVVPACCAVVTLTNV